MDTPYEIEIALEEADHAIGLSKLGVHRIELCANLSEGGLTPTVGQAKQVVQATSLPVYAMLRPRAGNFTYTEVEKEQILDDFAALSQTGIQGVVFGALSPANELDIDFCSAVVERARYLGLGTTFHRAIDAARQPVVIAQQLVELGVNRVLTSGGHPTVREGVVGIEALVAKFSRDISVQAGSGVNANTAGLLWSAGVRSFHMTARKFDRQLEDSLGFESRWVRDVEKIAALREVLEHLARVGG